VLSGHKEVLRVGVLIVGINRGTGSLSASRAVPEHGDLGSSADKISIPPLEPFPGESDVTSSVRKFAGFRF
jgi:hypothetical protein